MNCGGRDADGREGGGRAQGNERARRRIPRKPTPGTLADDVQKLEQPVESNAEAKHEYEQALEDYGNASSAFDRTRRTKELQAVASSLEEGRYHMTAAEAILRLSPLRIADHRRNVTHVLSAREARQWELPVIFICGLAEQQFPKRHSQDPLFPDAARQKLAQSGIRVRTAEELEREERFLFELARTRATSKLTLSYAEADTRGVRNMPSQFLNVPIQPCAGAIRPGGRRL